MIAGSAAHGNHYSILIRQHVIPIDLAPLMSRPRTGKVILLVIDLIASAPVFLLNL